VARDAGVDPDRILTSPYVRARQTAEIAAGILGFKDDLIETAALTPESAPDAVWEELRLYQDAGKVMLVGHEPLFSQLTAYLLNSPTLLVDFKKGALVRIDFDHLGPRPRGVLRWFLPPKLAEA
jgi:phosphohistidine phosphatase